MSKEQMIELIKRCWRKHCRFDSSIGWEELTDELCDGLANILGDEEYIRFQENY